MDEQETEQALPHGIMPEQRDVIEDEIVLGGINFRFIDTAGLRETKDVIEAMGVERSREQMKKASLIIYLFDLGNTTLPEIEEEERQLAELGIPYIKVGNKIDKGNPTLVELLKKKDFTFISAANKTNIEQLKKRILDHFHVQSVKTGDVLVTNLRHFQNLQQTHDALTRVLDGLEQGITGDFLAMDIRQALHYLGEITGTITSEDLLANIFGKFCIGK